MKDLMEKLLAERARATGDLRGFVEVAEKRDGGWTAEDRQEFDRRTADLDDLDKRIKTCKDRVESDRQVDEYRSGIEGILAQPGGNPLMETRAVQEKQIADFFLGKAPGNADNGRSLDISFRGLKVERDNLTSRNVVRDYTESRTGLVDGTTTAGGFLYGPSFRAVLYQHLIFNSAIRQTRATVITTGSGESLLLPKTTSHPASGTIVSEAAAINENDPAFGQGTLGAYKYANLVQVSAELEQDTAVDLLGYLAMSMGRALGNGSGGHFITGDGSSKPQGVLVGAGTASSVTGGTPASSGATFSEIASVYDKIIPPYQINGEWLMSQTALSKLRSLVNSQGTPIFMPSLSGGSPDTLFGKPVIVDPNMPAVAVGGTSIAFGDFAAYFIRDVDGIRFERSVDYAFNTDLVTYRAIQRTDGRLLDTTGAIGTYKGGTA